MELHKVPKLTFGQYLMSFYFLVPITMEMFKVQSMTFMQEETLT
jgi:hypothetical protein